MNKHKIVIYTTSDFPYGMAPENFVRQLAFGFRDVGVSVYINRLRWRKYSHDNDTGIKCDDIFFKIPIKNEIIKFFILMITILIIPFSLLKYKIYNNISSIILYGVEYAYLNLPFIVVCKLINVKIFRIITDIYPETSICPVWWKYPKVIAYNLQFRINNYFDGIVVLSNNLKDIIVNNGMYKNKIIVLNHFIDVDWLHSAKNRNKKDTGNIRIGYCGTFYESNGIGLLIEAFKELKLSITNCELLLIGEIDQTLDENTKEFLKNNNLGITITGLVDKDFVRDYLHSCDILINPRKISLGADVGFPTKVGEYLSCEKPVISVISKSLSEVLSHKNEIYFCYDDKIDSLVDAINTLLNNKTLRAKISYNGYIWAKENLEYKKQAIKLIRFINTF